VTPLYPQKLALTSPTGGGRSVGIVRSRTKATEFSLVYYRYSALMLVWAETRAQSGDWYGSGTLHPGQVLRGSLPSLTPTFRRSHFRHQVSRRERS